MGVHFGTWRFAHGASWAVHPLVADVVALWQFDSVHAHFFAWLRGIISQSLTIDEPLRHRPARTIPVHTVWLNTPA